jgi:hypothetical protein
MVTLGGHIQRPGQGLKQRFGPVMVILAGQEPGMQVQPAFVGQTLKKVGDEAGPHLADAVTAKLALKDKVASPTEIDGYQGQGFVHRDNRMTHADDAGAIPQSLGQGPAQHNGNIFNGMVFIDVQIATGFDLQVKPGMAGQGVQHVIQKANAGLDRGLAGPINIELDLDVGFAGLPGHTGSAGWINQE